MATEYLSAATAEKMSPLDWAIRPLKRYADFKGRAPRAEYWWFYLGTLIAQIPLTIVDKLLGDWSPLSTLFSLATLFPFLAVTVRRLHDTDRSGWWLAALVPIVVLGIVSEVTAGAAFQGQQLQALGSAGLALLIVAFIAFLIFAIVLLIFMVTRGTEGPNRYGPDPYGPDQLEEVFA